MRKPGKDLTLPKFLLITSDDACANASIATKLVVKYTNGPFMLVFYESVMGTWATYRKLCYISRGVGNRNFRSLGACTSAHFRGGVTCDVRFLAN